VLRRDGVVLPFARLSGTRWHQVWVLPERDPEVPIDLRSVPKRWWGPDGPAADWYAAIRGRAGFVALHVVQPDVVPAYCMRQIGLRTDYAGVAPRPPIDDHPYPKDGLAVTPRLDRVASVDVLDTAGPEAAALGDIVRAAFNDIERNIFRHPVSPRYREAIRPRLDAVYAVGDRPRYYYVEASRDYSEGRRDGECIAAAVGHAWIVRDRKGARALSTAVDVEDCDRSDAVYMTPLGIVRADGKAFWIAQFAGVAGESYQVIELKPVAVETALIRSGGSC